MDNENRPDITMVVDELDELLQEVFDIPEIDREKRFALYYKLLYYDKLEPIGYTVKEIQKILGKNISDTVNKKILDNSNKLYSLIDPTYIVVNYWSPLKRGKRHSVALKEKSASINRYEKKRSLAYACAFYALTFYCKRELDKSFSIVQYISDTAPHKRGLFACIDPECTNNLSFFNHNTNHCKVRRSSRERWICFPKVIRKKLLEQMGIEKEIKFALNKYSINYFHNSVKRLFHDEGAKEDYKFGKEIYYIINENLLKIKKNSGLDSYLKHAENHLNVFFNTEKSYHIDRLHTCIMLITHLMWKETCSIETNYMYIFPTKVSDTCCILTMGSRELFEDKLELAVTSISKSLFIHPLLREYQIAQVRNEDLTLFQTYRRLISHNLPKLFLAPTETQLRHMKSCVKQLKESNEQPLAVNELSKRLIILSSLHGHIDALWTALSKTYSSRNPFSKAIKEFPLEEVFNMLEGIVLFYREHAKAVWPNNRIIQYLKIEGPDDEIMNRKIYGHLDYLRECVFNLVSNSFTHIENSGDDLENSAIIKINANIDDAENTLSITVQDAAGGFKDDDFRNITEEVIPAINKAKEENDLVRILNKLCNQHIEKKASTEGSLNIGLLFCAAYLKYLEWIEGINRQGELIITKKYEIQDSPDLFGAKVTLIVPLGLR